MSNTFITSYSRKGVSNFLTDPDNLNGSESAKKYRGTVEVSLELKGSQSDANKEGSGTPSVSRTMEVYGPSEVLGISESSIRNIVPDPKSDPMSCGYMPYIEFYDSDFPWRYTPLKPNGKKLRPWLSLVVCKEGEYSLTKKEGVSYLEILSDSVLPDVEKLYLSAHASNEENSNKEVIEEASFSRLFCLRPLEPQTQYAAFLIPSFEQGRQQKFEGIDIQKSAWTKSGEGNKANGAFPVYYSWEFKSGDANFRTLAEKMNAINTAERAYKDFKDSLNIDITETGLNINAELYSAEKQAQYKVKESYLGQRKLASLVSLMAAVKVESKGAYSKKECPAIPMATYSLDEIVKNSPTGRIKLAALVEAMQDRLGQREDSYGNLPIAVALSKYDRKAVAPSDETKKLIEAQQQELKTLLSRNPVFVENEITKGGQASLQDDEDPWVVPPVYGARQFLSDKADLEKDTLARELNLDFENRIAAGLGATVVQDNQEDFVNQAWQQIETVNKHNQRIRELVQMNQLNDISGRRISSRVRTPFGRSKALRSDSAMRVGSRFKHTMGNPVQMYFSSNQGNGQEKVNEEVKAGTKNNEFPKEQGLALSELETLFSEEFLSGNKSALLDCLFTKKITTANFWNIFPELSVLRNYVSVKKKTVIDFSSSNSSSSSNLSNPCNSKGFWIFKNLKDVIELSINRLDPRDTDMITDMMPYRIWVMYKEIIRQIKSRIFSQCLFEEFHDFFMKANRFDTCLSAFDRSWSQLRVKVGKDSLGIFVKEDDYNELPNAKGTWCTKISGFTYDGEEKDIYIFNYDHADTKTKATFYMSKIKLKLEEDDSGDGGKALYFRSDTKIFTFTINPIIDRFVGDVIKGYLSLARCEYIFDDIMSHQWYPTYATVDEPSECNALDYNFSTTDYEAFVSNSVNRVGELISEINALNNKSEAEEEKAEEETAPSNNGYASRYAAEKLTTLFKTYYPNRTVDLAEYAYSKYPIMKEPEFPNPAFFYLREMSEKFILPSIDAIDINSIVCFQSNPKFEEAFLAGMNTEMGRELLWREYPTDQRGSYFRKFWDKDELPEKFDESYFDVKRMEKWNGRLGENHTRKGSLMVFIIKAELMRSYPETMVNISYFENGKFNTTDTLNPEISGWLNDDTYFVGYYEEDIESYCKSNRNRKHCLVFYEQQQNLRFNNDAKSDYDSSADYAKRMSVTATVFGYPLSAIRNIQ